MFYDINNLKSFFEIYSLIARNKTISIIMFLFKLISKSIIEKKKINLIILIIININS